MTIHYSALLYCVGYFFIWLICQIIAGSIKSYSISKLLKSHIDLTSHHFTISQQKNAVLQNAKRLVNMTHQLKVAISQSIRKVVYEPSKL